MKIQKLQEGPQISTKPVVVRNAMEDRNKGASRVPPVPLYSEEEIDPGDVGKGKSSDSDKRGGRR